MFHPSLFPFEVYFLEGEHGKLMRPYAVFMCVLCQLYVWNQKIFAELYEHHAVGGDPSNTW